MNIFEKPKIPIQSNISNIEISSQLPYKAPIWSAPCPNNYSINIIKNGSIVQNLILKDEETIVFGRISPCKVIMQHPSISRFHAVLQYCPKNTDRYSAGWYLYDLDSTHGTRLNKNNIEPRTFVRLRVGHIIHFGGSTRIHILEGPEEDQEEELPMPIRNKKVEETEDDGNCLWGIDNDAKEDDNENEINPFSEETHEDLYRDDPKKTLKHFFNREGLDFPEFQYTEAGFNKIRCKIDLPDGLFSEVTISGGKKEAQVQCALEACRILDRIGELSKSNRIERQKTKHDEWKDNDFYDSDDDEFLDRTGDIKRKRENRIKLINNTKEVALTYDEITQKIDQKSKRINEIENILEKAKQDNSKLSKEGLDALDDYMNSLKSGALDTKSKIDFRRELIELRKEIGFLQRLQEKSKPNLFPKKFYSKFFFEKRKTKKSETLIDKVEVSNKHELRSIDTDVNYEKNNSVGISSNISIENKHEIKDIDTVCNVNNDTNKDEKQLVKNKIIEKECTSKILKVEESIKIEKEDKKNTVSKRIEDWKDEELKEKLQKNITKEIDNVDELPSKIEQNLNNDESRALSRKKKVSKRKFFSKDYCQDDPDYTTWLPPTNQEGDGKTSLNDKFGY